MRKEQITDLIRQMSLEEKASLCSGLTFWSLRGIARLGIPSITVTDGPHGLRKQAGTADHLGLNASIPSTCFPAAATTACSWDPDLLRQMGKAIAEECRQEHVAVILGPGVNSKRSPLCGRNFEYFSEEPLLAGELAAAWIQGVQSEGVGTSLKHYACNNQETARLISNSIVDKRALHEIYLAGFERAVRKGQPLTIMCSYNRINGIYACENSLLLQKELRDIWGFEGVVMTDWGAMTERISALRAGTDLEMPGPADSNNRKIAEAVRSGTLDESILDRTVFRILDLIFKTAGSESSAAYDISAHHELARKIADESFVLLKNKENQLPLAFDTPLAVIGAFAREPRYQGSGSSRINPHKVVPLTEALDERNISYEYAEGYHLDSDTIDDKLISDACRCASGKPVVIVNVGLPDSYESEGYDRTHLNLPDSHNLLVRKLAEVNSHIIVVLYCGAPVILPWKDKVNAVLLAYLGGQAVGDSLADILLGQVNPSGHLGESFPSSLDDTPCRTYFAVHGRDIQYRESILTGYRYYDWAGKDVQFPFGYGLSYTKFALSDLRCEWDSVSETGSTSVRVENIGSRSGKQVVQWYYGKPESPLLRSPRQLCGFKKVMLKPGESTTVTVPLDKRSFSFFDGQTGAWAVEKGTYTLEAGTSSRDLPLRTTLVLDGIEIHKCDYPLKKDTALKDGIFTVDQTEFSILFPSGLPVSDNTRITINSSVSEVLATEKGRKYLQKDVDDLRADFSRDGSGSMFLSMLQDLPLRALTMFSGGRISREQVENLILLLNS